MNLKNIKSKQEAVSAMQELYMNMKKQIMLLKSNNSGEREFINRYQEQTKETLEEVLKNLDKEQKIQFLKNRIEEMFNDRSNIEIKEKVVAIFGEYYQSLIEIEEKIQNSESKENIVLDLIKKSDIKDIYEDKSKKEKVAYGDFVKNDKSPEVLFSNKETALIELDQYITRKTKLSEDDRDTVCATLDKEELSKYEFQIAYENGKTAGITFFGETKIGKIIKKGNQKYMIPMLSAVKKAKEENRSYIGRISLIDKELGTYVTQYDENLEKKVKKLEDKELEESKKEQSQQNTENKKDSKNDNLTPNK